MRQIFWSSAVLVCFLALVSVSECRSMVKREANPSIDPHHEHNDHHNLDDYRDKRKIEVIKGVKNALLGFVFDKINKFIDHKTHWVDQLDKQNILKNKAHGIEPPKDPVISLSSILSETIGHKLESAGPLINVVVGKLGSGSSGGSGHGSGGGAGFNFGSLVGGHQ
ncbi:uncharacterized protein LOC115890984 [Sitophilus oryzae]|uniref:Uncharacterized protein LOC115890984 n=1 Tax=Sitophilus oryzae TaxID=7048 RepID=A0A6J2YVK6_SITOR|nr:uncharacterized protein LOC115890984 [Sitophilus oryzae]XP_030767222.1 uncharacterized protein LOC115890984 [Sitophilus oryzae]